MKREEDSLNSHAVINLGHMQHNPSISQIQQQQSQRISLRNTITKVILNRNYTCFHIFESVLYAGTSNSKVHQYLINISANNGMQLLEGKNFYPHCDIVQSITANAKYVIVIPKEENSSLLRVWSAETLHILHAYQGHKAQISKAIFLKCSDHIVSASYDGTVRVWVLTSDFSEDSHCKIFKGILPVLQIKEIDREIIVLGGDDCFITFWNWRKQQVILKQFAHAGSVMFVQVLDDMKLFSVGGDGKFKIWQIQQNIPTEQKIRLNPMSLFYSKYKLIPLQEKKLKFTTQLQCARSSNGKVICVDRRGRIFIYHHDKVIEKSIKIDYTESICSIAVYTNYLLAVSTHGEYNIVQLDRFTSQQEIEKNGYRRSYQHTEIDEKQVKEPQNSLIETRPLTIKSKMKSIKLQKLEKDQKILASENSMHHLPALTGKKQEENQN